MKQAGNIPDKSENQAGKCSFGVIDEAHNATADENAGS